jgi:epoxyqueuosine reductase
LTVKFVSSALERVTFRLGTVATNPKIRYVPHVSVDLRRKLRPPTREPFDLGSVTVPPQLQGPPGIVTDPEQQAKAFADGPLPDFNLINWRPLTFLRGHMWQSMLPVAPRWRAASNVARKIAEASPSSAPDAMTSPDVLLAELNDLGTSVGLSAIGVTRWDPQYIFKSMQGTEIGDRIVVCLLEQAWGPTQTIPSVRAERTALGTYAECVGMVNQLGQHLSTRGYKVRIYDASGPGMAIAFAVAAGLGQMGLNGQLLSYSGSRCRIILMNTDAPLPIGKPRDFGVPALCDACQICVRRCPPGAIPLKRRMKRGVEKAPIKPERCLPIAAQAHGCAICMKVCPAQRYGLKSVLEEFGRTGQVMGKGTDELESYHWPLDGRRYGPGEKPRITDEIIRPTGMAEVQLGDTDGEESLSEKEMQQARGWA